MRAPSSSSSFYEVSCERFHAVENVTGKVRDKLLRNHRPTKFDDLGESPHTSQ